jgi:predicted negative regulator of RcsB-dependent stress response
MLRGVAAFVILASIAGFFAFRYYSQEQAFRAQEARQMNDLNAQLETLRSDNNNLKDQLAKVQDENNNLKGYNDVLKKALEQAKVTGKVPEIMPYPPK